MGSAENVGPRTFTSAVTICFNQYAQANGRAPRSEYWYFVLFTMIATAAADIINLIVIGNSYQILGTLVSLALLVPSVTVLIRRLHDTDRSGWWWLIGFIPIIGWILLLIWTCTRGTRGPNQYGPDPLGDAAAWRSTAVA